MAVPILCVTALFFLAWVILLKAHIAHIEKENERLREAMRTGLRDLSKGIEISKPRWSK